MGNTLNNTRTADFHEQGVEWVRRNQHLKAIKCFLQQLEIKPQVKTYKNLAIIFQRRKKFTEAIKYLRLALALEPSKVSTLKQLGCLYKKTNAYTDAIDCYKKALVLTPEDEKLTYILAALTQSKMPVRAPFDYIESIFDELSKIFDQHLVENLDYRIPDKLAQLIIDVINPADKSLSILDLGCGTGLSGVPLLPLTNTLIGVDASAEMLNKARDRNIYDRLIQQDLFRLDQSQLPTVINLVVAADVFVYIGDLSPVFLLTRNVLADGGFFCFSVEQDNTVNYKLHKTMRYTHSEHYLKMLADDFGFTVRALMQTTIRKERGRPVDGCIVLLENQNQPPN